MAVASSNQSVLLFQLIEPITRQHAIPPLLSCNYYRVGESGHDDSSCNSRQLSSLRRESLGMQIAFGQGEGSPVGDRRC